jgi:hypothetical protein
MRAESELSPHRPQWQSFSSLRAYTYNVLASERDNSYAGFPSTSGMSALGHKQTYAVQKGMSALPPKATLNASKKIHSGPIADVAKTCARTDSEVITLPLAGICLANPACAARQAWPRFRRNGASYRCGSRDWPHYKRIPHAARVQRKIAAFGNR